MSQMKTRIGWISSYMAIRESLDPTSTILIRVRQLEIFSGSWYLTG